MLCACAKVAIEARSKRAHRERLKSAGAGEQSDSWVGAKLNPLATAGVAGAAGVEMEGPSAGAGSASDEAATPAGRTWGEFLLSFALRVLKDLVKELPRLLAA